VEFFFILLAHKKKLYFLFLNLQAFFISQNFNFLIQALKLGNFFGKKTFLKAKRLYMGSLIEAFILPTHQMFLWVKE
jgi:hypothetical protein